MCVLLDNKVPLEKVVGGGNSHCNRAVLSIQNRELNNGGVVSTNKG